jgi:hypothetical protein
MNAEPMLIDFARSFNDVNSEGLFPSTFNLIIMVGGSTRNKPIFPFKIQLEYSLELHKLPSDSRHLRDKLETIFGISREYDPITETGSQCLFITEDYEPELVQVAVGDSVDESGMVSEAASNLGLESQIPMFLTNPSVVYVGLPLKSGIGRIMTFPKFQFIQRRNG